MLGSQDGVLLINVSFPILYVLESYYMIFNMSYINITLNGDDLKLRSALFGKTPMHFN